jgi:hypothetical protein
MIEQASLVIGEGNWAVKSDSLLGYKINGGKYYPREMSVVRATTGTRINEDGLVELVPYNLLQQSETFNLSPWVNSLSTISTNTTTSPNGTTDAEKLIEDTNTGLHQVYQEIFASGSIVDQYYTFSCYAKASERNKITFILQTPSVSEATFDLINGTASITGGAGTAGVAIENVGNGWYRCSIYRLNTTAGYIYGNIILNNGSTTSYTGNGTSGAFIWGAQLNIGSTAKDYLPTTDRLDVARIDYSSGSGALLVEPQRTNVVLNSENFSNASWLKTAITLTANATISPDGTTNATSIIPTTANVGNHRVYEGGLNTIATAAYSIYVKPNGYNRVALRESATTGAAIGYDLLNETIITTYSTGGCTASGGIIEEVGNGWYRISGIFSFATATSQSLGFYIVSPSWTSGDPESVTWAGNGTDGVLVWGAQFESGSYPTSYIPTTSASVTRNADSIGKNPCAQAESAKTWFADADLSYLQINGSNSCMVLTIRGGSYEGYFRYFVNNQLHFQYTNPTSSVDIALSNAIPTNTTKRLKMAARIEDNNFAFYVNGVQIGTNVVATKATGLNILELGNYSNIAQYQLSDGINAIALWDEALTNTQLAELTTL